MRYCRHETRTLNHHNRLSSSDRASPLAQITTSNHLDHLRNRAHLICQVGCHFLYPKAVSLRVKWKSEHTHVDILHRISHIPLLANTQPVHHLDLGGNDDHQLVDLALGREHMSMGMYEDMDML
jgi:hypothetical protein